MTQIQNRFGILKLEFGICLGFRILNLGFPPEHSEVRLVMACFLQNEPTTLCTLRTNPALYAVYQG